MITLLIFYFYILFFVLLIFACGILTLNLRRLYLGQSLMPHEYKESLMALGYVIFSLMVTGVINLFYIIKTLLKYLL